MIIREKLLFVEQVCNAVQAAAAGYGRPFGGVPA